LDVPAWRNLAISGFDASRRPGVSSGVIHHEAAAGDDLQSIAADQLQRVVH
jgi:hypothetical protein